jgi:ABC-type ATPase involved in cell division
VLIAAHDAQLAEQLSPRLITIAQGCVDAGAAAA